MTKGMIALRNNEQMYDARRLDQHRNASWCIENQLVSCGA